MSVQARTIQEVAHDALEELESAKAFLGKLESLLLATLDHKEGMSPHIRNLVGIAWTLASDGANAFDCSCEEISASLSKCATLGAGGDQ
ncbi:UNVERIFIED_ORG: hypothetical protein EDF86_1548 [Pseudomonas psychrophila]